MTVFSFLFLLAFLPTGDILNPLIQEEIASQISVVESLWNTRRYISSFVLRPFGPSFLKFSSNNLNIEPTLLDTYLQSSYVSFYTS